MSDNRFYTVLLVALTGVCVVTLALLDYLQIKELNTELVNRIIVMVTPVIGFLIMMAQNKSQTQVAKDEVKEEVKKTAEALEKKADEIAETASQLAPKKK